MTPIEERRYAWLELTADELLSLLRGEARIPQLAGDGPAGDVQILAFREEFETVYNEARLSAVKLGLCSRHFSPCEEAQQPPTLDWKPEPVADRKIKFREFF